VSQIWERSPKVTDELSPYEGDIENLTEEDVIFFDARYELPNADKWISRNSSRYVLPIYDTHGVPRGYVARQGYRPKRDGVFYPSPLYGRSSGQKAYTFMHARGPVQSFYRCSHWYKDGAALVLVEDQLSAIKAAHAGFNSCALLGMPVAAIGSYSGADRIREIASLRPKEVVVAMDEDATDKAFQFARNWGMAFNKCRVALLDSDIKDTPLADIREVLGL
jgi:hypothetical protein